MGRSRFRYVSEEKGSEGSAQSFVQVSFPTSVKATKKNAGKISIRCPTSMDSLLALLEAKLTSALCRTDRFQSSPARFEYFIKAKAEEDFSMVR